MREYSPPKYPFASSGKVWFALVPVCSLDWTGHELQTWNSTSWLVAGNFRTDPWTTPWHCPQGTKRQTQLAPFPDKCSVSYTLLPPRTATLGLTLNILRQKLGVPILLRARSNRKDLLGEPHVSEKKPATQLLPPRPRLASWVLLLPLPPLPPQPPLLRLASWVPLLPPWPEPSNANILCYQL